MSQVSFFFLLLIPLSACSPVTLPVDCNDLYVSGLGHSGVYSIFPAGPLTPVQVYCDMGCGDEPTGRKWTIIQRRMDGNINFYRGWDQYRTGFGQASGEYWLGLENIHALTQQKTYEMRVEMEDFEGAKVYAHFTTFSVGTEQDGYTLTLDGFENGGAGTSMNDDNVKKFSTFDKDQGTHNCPKTYYGGWWYGACHSVNPNGLYLWGSSPYGIGINWSSWKGCTYSLKAITMKIRPTQ
ncbi:microfibril-associated glycoprotein 4-like [Genypterus blacodes]|uniref:microfibril-associated glycoprotein 4-like n=1 Tax=Genypterus blacodes TaxID=154954 RepID=UPI003F76A6C0